MSGKLIIICNTSPLLILSQLCKLDLLKYLFDKIYIAQGVYEEIVEKGNVKLQRETIKKATIDYIEVIKPTVDYPFKRTNLGKGEKATLNLALQIKHDSIILDDRQAINEAKELNLKTTLTTDILKGAEKRNLIKSYREIMQKLAKYRIYPPESKKLIDNTS